jgi:hypothetical protein
LYRSPLYDVGLLGVKAQRVSKSTEPDQPCCN